MPAHSISGLAIITKLLFNAYICNSIIFEGCKDEKEGFINDFRWLGDSQKQGSFSN